MSDEFISDIEDNNSIPFKYELKEDKYDEYYDSYGNEDSTLTKVFYLPEYDILVQFNGTRQSYSGEEWSNNFKEVKLTTKTIQVYE